MPDNGKNSSATPDPSDPTGRLAEIAADLESRDPGALAAALPVLRILTALWHRSDVRDVRRIPDGGALVVSNHSGGMVAVDVPLLAVAIHDEFGDERPLYCLTHDMMFLGPLGPIMRRFGFIPASREHAAAVLASGAVTIVFPGGDYDTLRPSSKANVIDFNGRTGYVRTALAAGVPIVPVVSIGGQENQLYLTRGEGLGRFSPLGKVLRTKYLPITFGFPFGLTPMFPPNLPLPTKIVTQVLEPMDLSEFGPDPDVAEIDVEVRRRMQEALDELARQRRFPVLG